MNGVLFRKSFPAPLSSKVFPVFSSWNWFLFEAQPLFFSLFVELSVCLSLWLYHLFLIFIHLFMRVHICVWEYACTWCSCRGQRTTLGVGLLIPAYSKAWASKIGKYNYLAYLHNHSLNFSVEKETCNIPRYHNLGGQTLRQDHRGLEFITRFLSLHPQYWDSRHMPPPGSEMALLKATLQTELIRSH